MRALISPFRIDVLGATGLPKDSWESMLDELKAEHVPCFTPTGKRIAMAAGPTGRLDAFVYRTSSLSDGEIIRVLGKYGIPASVGTD
jgi:hypothetical protein